MGATARSVRAERDRRRLPPRRAFYRWTRRIMGLLATAAFLGVGVASYLMIAPDEHGGAAVDLAPAATPPASKHHHRAHKPKGPKPLTKAQKAARADAVAELRTQGYTALKATDYDPRARFRVLIGRPVGNAGAGSYAFFFNRGTYIGRDAFAPTAKLRLVSSGKKNLTLGYSVCCPQRTVKVRFRLEPQGVHALDTIPPSYQRAVQR